VHAGDQEGIGSRSLSRPLTEQLRGSADPVDALPPGSRLWSDGVDRTGLTPFELMPRAPSKSRANRLFRPTSVGLLLAKSVITGPALRADRGRPDIPHRQLQSAIAIGGRIGGAGGEASRLRSTCRSGTGSARLLGYRVVDAAYERRSVAVTSNLLPSGFDTITLATATVDRLLHHAHVVLTERAPHDASHDA
jgi:hypothetical protein